mmetsp:Transcript_33244/g.50142  ORF Transcript_33244/g.50142 Transcript_33244/m.50142 type:complete len:85 (-) Transcript_33244:93-347(-)
MLYWPGWLFGCESKMKWFSSLEDKILDLVVLIWHNLELSTELGKVNTCYCFYDPEKTRWYKSICMAAFMATLPSLTMTPKKFGI